MNRVRSIGLFLVLGVLTVAPRAAHAADTEDAVIKGVADFLLDRANDNYVYIFQRKLESNELMKKYLPNTLRVARAGELRTLLTNKQLWRRALEEDLEAGGRTFIGSILSDLGRFIDEKLCPKGRAPELDKPCEDAKKAFDTAKAGTGKVDVQFSEPAALAMTAFTPSAQVQLAKDVLASLKSDLDQIRVVACSKGSYTICVVQGLALLDAFAHADYTFNCFLLGNWCWNGQRDKTLREENEDFKDFRRYALFFAQMADAAETKDPDQVKALLKSVTIPPVSFGIKREPHATRVMITAYLAGAWSRETNVSHHQAYGILAPVGFEISQARGSGNSLSLLVSPLDFGYPLSLKLNNVDATVKGSDVVVPAAYVFYGLKDYPVAFGTGYSRGRSVDNPDQRVGRWVILIGFDMPLFKLH